MCIGQADFESDSILRTARFYPLGVDFGALVQQDLHHRFVASI